jgi:aspartate-semialdehyde dehydrogenase
MNDTRRLKRIPVGVLGATGTVGQRFVERLVDHPWFELAALAASDRSRGKTYGETSRWRLPSPLPGSVAEMTVASVTDELPCAIVFSALDSSVAREVEPECARRGMFVFSNASAYRMDSDVPLLIPEVNPDSLALIARQRRERRWKGAIVTNSNCSTMFLAIALAPLDREFGVSKAFVSTMQAVSGAGYPGVPSLDILGNVIPDIPEEAAKMEREVVKILGRTREDSIVPAPFPVSAMTYRVAVEDGHMESVSVALSRRVSAADVESAWREFRGPDDVAALPSAPRRPIHYLAQTHRPQPRRDVDTEKGMATLIGGLKPCPIFDWKFTVLGHNTVRGAAGASVLNAEYASVQGLLD